MSDSKDFKTFEDEQVRLHILLMLKEDPDYTMNDDILRKMLTTVGFNLDAIRLSANLHWLKRADMVTMEQVSIYHIVKLTKLGDDIACGRTTFSGIARPSPDQTL